MGEYEVEMTFTVKADDKFEVVDIIKNALQDVCELQFEDEVNADLFKEMGIIYE